MVHCITVLHVTAHLQIIYSAEVSVIIHCVTKMLFMSVIFSHRFQTSIS